MSQYFPKPYKSHGDDIKVELERNNNLCRKIVQTQCYRTEKKFVLSLHCNGDNSYLFVNGGEELKFKTKTFSDQVKQNKLCLGNLSSDWSSISSTNTGLYGSVYDFAVDYSPVNSVGTIYDIHRYFMKKHNII